MASRDAAFEFVTKCQVEDDNWVIIDGVGYTGANYTTHTAEIVSFIMTGCNSCIHGIRYFNGVVSEVQPRDYRIINYLEGALVARLNLTDLCKLLAVGDEKTIELVTSIVKDYAPISGEMRKMLDNYLQGFGIK